MRNKPLAKEAAERTAAVSLAELSLARRSPVRRYFDRHPVRLDLLVVLGYLVLVAASLASALSRGLMVPPAVIALSAAALMFRRRHPVLVTALLTVGECAVLYADPMFQAVGMSLWFGLYAVGRKVRASWTYAMAAAASLAPVTVLLIHTRFQLTDYLADIAATDPSGAADENVIVLFMAAVIVLSNLIAGSIGITVRRNRQHDRELMNWAARVQELASATERNRIAREMHDVVAHSLSVMIALSDGAAVVLKRDPVRAGEVLAELSSTGRTALADMRRVIGVLRASGDAPLQPQPVSGSLQEMLDGFTVAGLPLAYAHTGPALPADAAFQLTVYRILQESLTNVLRYGRSVTKVMVAVQVEDNEVRIQVTDDGLGPAAQAQIGSGQGLVGIEERAAFYGGHVYAGPGPDRGWVVHVIMTAPAGAEPARDLSEAGRRDK